MEGIAIISIRVPWNSMRETGNWNRTVFHEAIARSGVQLIDEEYRYQ